MLQPLYMVAEIVADGDFVRMHGFGSGGGAVLDVGAELTREEATNVGRFFREADQVDLFR